jgi:hypothetical protein
MGKKYPALQTISFLFKLLASIVVIFGIIHIICVILVSAELIDYQIRYFPLLFSTFPFAFIPLFLCLLISLILWAFSELIICLVDIEYNTRQNTNNRNTSEPSLIGNTTASTMKPNQKIEGMQQKPISSVQLISQDINHTISTKPIEKSSNDISTDEAQSNIGKGKSEEPSKAKTIKNIPFKATLKKLLYKKIW